MRILFICLVCVATVACAAGVDDRFRPAIVDQKVDSSVFPKEAEIKAPVVEFGAMVGYPIESHSGFAGEVRLYIKINDFGYPTRIAVFHSSNQVFERSAVANAIQTRWKTDPAAKLPSGAWFVYDVLVVRRD